MSDVAASTLGPVAALYLGMSVTAEAIAAPCPGEVTAPEPGGGSAPAILPDTACTWYPIACVGVARGLPADPIRTASRAGGDALSSAGGGEYSGSPPVRFDSARRTPTGEPGLCVAPEGAGRRGPEPAETGTLGCEGAGPPAQQYERESVRSFPRGADARGHRRSSSRIGADEEDKAPDPHFGLLDL